MHLNGGGWWRDIARRRRLVGAVVGFVVLVVGAASVLGHPATYASGATIVFMDSTSVQELSFRLHEPVDGSQQAGWARSDMKDVGDAFVRIYSSWSKQHDLAEAGLNGRLTVSTVSSMIGLIAQHGPVFSIEVEASSPVAAQNGAALVATDVARELAERQSGYDPRLSAHVVTVTPATTAVLLPGSPIRSAFAFGILAVLAALSSTWILGSIDRVRTRHHAQQARRARSLRDSPTPRGGNRRPSAQVQNA